MKEKRNETDSEIGKFHLLIFQVRKDFQHVSFYNTINICPFKAVTITLKLPL